MNNKSILEKINSKYIIQTIVGYIERKDFLFELIFYSKSLQKKLEISLFDYQEKYLNKNLSWENYLFTNENNNQYDKNLLKQNLKDDLNFFKIDDKSIQKIVYNYYKRHANELLSQNTVKDLNVCEFTDSIDFYSPFFDSLSKTEVFELVFNIAIEMKLIKKFNLQKDIAVNFDKLNNANINYTSISFFFENFEDINTFNYNFHIIFKEIKKFFIYQERQNYADDIIVKYILSVVNISDNLVYLILSLNCEKEINPNSAKLLNYLKCLEFLGLYTIKFSSVFTLKVDTLKKLIIENCTNIAIDQESILTLKFLSLTDNLIVTDSLLLLPELETLSLNSSSGLLNYDSIIDFSALEKVKTYKGRISYFLLLENSPIEEAELTYNKDTLKEEIKMFENFCIIKSLKNISFYITKISDNDLSKLEYENFSITKAKIEWINEENDCSLYNLVRIFPNLSEVSINLNYKDYATPNIYLIELPDCKLNNINISIKTIVCKSIKLYCQSYEKLQSIHLEISLDEIVIASLPFFFENNSIIFKELKVFFLQMHEINLDLLNNLYTNFDNMPSLTEFSINCWIKDLDEVFYYKFVKKLLSIKSIRIIKVSIHNDEKLHNYKKYSRNELRNIFPDINFNLVDKIGVLKVKEKDEQNNNCKHF